MERTITPPNLIGNYRRESIQDERELLRLLTYDVSAASYKKRVIFVAGHFPVAYSDERAYAAVNQWGAFTTYSLDLACRVAKHEIEESGKRYAPPAKDVRFILLADDINYEDFGENSRFNRHQKSRKRNNFYKNFSGLEAKVPTELQEIFDKYNIPNDLIIRQNHRKNGRKDCLFFSERVLRAGRETEKSECAKAYRGLLDSHYFDKENDHLVLFIPDSCTGNICNRTLGELQSFEDSKSEAERKRKIFWKNFDPLFSATHVTMQTDSTFLGISDIPSIWQWGVSYRRDMSCL